ncbi:serine hydrolase [Streptomyces sp. NPDC085481]|uniref:serine hydrolase n=1 Tax=Streptomyces sp. NPDC085481 TaxID=3365727 RepID=UPI0037D1AC03
MTHGGGTVAGESPDKAEQRESAKPSQDPTPVGGEGRDPRLSVLDGRVDQPTAVFKALAPRTAPEAEAETVPEDAPVEADGSEDGPGSGSGPGEGDRLREAVAAWVATEDDGEAEAEDGRYGGETPAEEPAKAEADPEPDSRTQVFTRLTRDAEPTAPARPESESPKADAPPAGEPSGKAADGESWFARNAAAPEAEGPKAGDSKGEAPKAEAPTDEEPEPAPAPKAGAVDQPTAVFKAVKPPVEAVKPPVDQPTTALKLPESMFVPLQGDIPQEQPKPTPKQQPAPQPAPKPQPKAAAPTPVPPSLAEAERTRQQPLPPRPPLEILAELTNTPPPPVTPLRNTVRRLKIWTPLVLLLIVVFAVVQFVRPLPAPALTLSAAPTYTFEGGELRLPWPSEGQGAAEVEGVGSLGTYGPQKPAPIASVAKTMTAYVIMRDHTIKGTQKGPEIEVDKTAGEQAKAKDESTAPIKEGETYTQKELLQLLMIPSGNNVARLLARWDAGSEAAFVEKMNAAAKQLGMTDSTYTDPSGLQSTTVSTPLDQLKLAKAVMQYDVFREIVDMPNVTIDGIPGQIENNNKILLKPGVSGIKTGSSTPAGGNLLWSANTVVDGKKQRILGIVMGAKDADQLWQKLDLAIANSLTIIQQAQKDVTSAAVVRKGQVVGYVDDGLGGRTPVVATKELRAVGWPGLKVDLELTDGGKAVPHTGRTGDVVGQISIGTGNGKVSAPVALQKDLAEPGFGTKLTRLG